ncbi:MAG: glycosyltransferase family 2 protein [Bryobacteraceae bacterium]
MIGERRIPEVSAPAVESGRNRACTPKLSVIVPVFAAQDAAVDLLRSGLDKLAESEVRPFELLIADDCSPSPHAEQIARLAREYGARLVRLETNSGPGMARNRAAKEAEGDVLVFLDADTTVHPETLGMISRVFESDPLLDAVCGSYDTRPSVDGTVSQFRNLLHSFVHRNAKRNTSTFWSGCGAVRRQRFLAAGGFSSDFSRPCIEDVEFGYRLQRAGGKLRLEPRIEVTHHKDCSLANMVRTDLFDRAIPWTELLERYPLPFDLNFRITDRLSTTAVVLLPVIAIIAARHGGWFWGLLAALAASVGLLNASLLRFMANVRGLGFAVRSFPLLFVYFGTCAAGYLAGRARLAKLRDRYLWPTVAVIAVALGLMQWFSGAWRASYDGHPDEAAHFVSSLMIHDFLVSPTIGNPLEWARQYYLRYPEVAIGQWPPGYHLLQASWWLIWGPSRAGTMSFQWLTGLLALAVLYRVCRSALPLAVCWGIAGVLTIAPVFQEGLNRGMADLLCLLWSVLVLDALVRFHQKRDTASIVLAVIWIGAALATKGTAVSLVLALAATLASRRFQKADLRWLVLSAGAVGLFGTWYLLAGNLTHLGGLGFRWTWPGPLFLKTVGFGFLLLSAIGLRRQPLALAALAVLASTLAMSTFVRAMVEIRHWIMAVPAVLVLSGFALEQLRSRQSISLALAGAFITFPFHWYRQTDAGYAELLARLDRPSRMLVSSEGVGEGAWIAAVAASEQRPGSFVVRASKVLSESDWSGRHYRLLTKDSASVQHRLDELAVDIVVLHDAPDEMPLAHHQLLRETMDRGAWRQCATASKLEAYCRIKEPTVARRALRLNIRGREFVEQID